MCCAYETNGEGSAGPLKNDVITYETVTFFDQFWQQLVHGCQAPLPLLRVAEAYSSHSQCFWRTLYRDHVKSYCNIPTFA